MRRLILLGSLVVLSGCQQAAAQQQTHSGGRYVIVLSTITARDTYLLDTATGETWQMVQDSQTKATSWERVPRER